MRQAQRRGSRWSQWAARWVVCAVVACAWVAVGGGALMGCAEDVGDIDRTQPNKLKKADLNGTWYMMETVTKLPATSRATFVGETGKTEKIFWRVEESYLLAYRAYELLPGSDNADDPRFSDPDLGAPLAAFPILSHFDVQREYNANTGEQSNVLVENTTDRPWYERDYMRVDWSQNVITDFDFVSGWLPMPQAAYTQEAERELSRSIYWERAEGGELTYFDVPRRLLLEPSLDGCIISGLWVTWDTEDCAAAEVELVTAFAKTEPERDYEPLHYTNQNMSRFGYFRSERSVHDSQRGVLESGRQLMANRHNIWQASYRRDEAGEFARDDQGARVLIPVAEREVRTVPYFMSATFPSDPLILEAARDTIAQWDVIGREAASLSTGRALDAIPSVFVLCSNPVADGEHAACGAPGFSPRPGDLRYSTLHWVEYEQLEGPLGYGPVSSDPETGEVISGRAYVYGGALSTYAAWAVDVIRLMNGDLQPDELVDADHIRDLIRERSRVTAAPHTKAQTDPNARRLSPKATHPRRDNKRARRDIQRRDLRTFDAQAVRDRLDHAQALGARPGDTDELTRALTARLNVDLDQLPLVLQDQIDPARWLSPTYAKERKARRLRAMAKSVDMLDMIDPSVEGIARAYAGRTDYDQIWRELRAQVFKSTALHEVGHTLGLRHNFQGSYDSLNYFDRYWELRTENVFAPDAGEKLFLQDLYVMSAQSEDQINGRMREYQYASIMDYGLTFNSDIQGLGKYDRAAIVFGYTSGEQREGFVEVFQKPLNALGRAGEILTSLTEQGQPFNDLTSPAVPYLERWHYTTFIQSFPAIEDAFDRRWQRLDDVLTEGGDARAVRVPYLFCSDEWESALLSCRVWDAGADPFEVTLNISAQYRAYYYFNNFKRDRLGWDPIYALFTAFERQFLPLSDIYQNWYLSPEGADSTMDDYYWLAVNTGFNLLAEVIATPPYGTFCVTPQGSLFNLTEEPTPQRDIAYYLDTYCDRDQPLYRIAQGDGRRRFSTYDVEHGGYYFADMPQEAGHYWTTLAALWAMVDPEAFVLGSDADVGTFAISYYDLFDGEVNKIVNSVLTEDFATYSPRLIAAADPQDAANHTLIYPVASPVYDEATGLELNPEDGAQITQGAVAICQACERDTDCLGYTGFTGGTFCQPVLSGSDATFCLRDCTDGDASCASGERCNADSNCTPVLNTCAGQTPDCSATEPFGACAGGGRCDAGVCRAPLPIVETDATFALMTDVLYYGMLYSTWNFSTRFNDQINVFKLGTAEAIEPSAGFEVISFTDPILGDTYGALTELCTGDDTIDSAQCRFGLNRLSGGAQLMLRGQELAANYDAAVTAYWEYDGADPAQDLALQRRFSRARFEMESHLEKLNTVRATFGIFGKVY
jgi:hypothetical protein